MHAGSHAGAQTGTMMLTSPYYSKEKEMDIMRACGEMAADSERTAKIASVHQFDFVLKSEGAGYLDRIWFFNASLEGFIICYITVSHVWKPHPMGWC